MQGMSLLVQVKEPYGKLVILIWLLVGFHPATRSVHSTPAYNAREGGRQYIEKNMQVI